MLAYRRNNILEVLTAANLLSEVVEERLAVLDLVKFENSHEYL